MGRPSIPLEQRFWQKVDIGGPDDCWPWTGKRTSRTLYGSVRYDGKEIGAHRAAWMLTHGEMPSERVLHTCDNPPCCNPAHLLHGSALDNSRDMVSKSRQANGERLPQSKLTAEYVREIRDRAAKGEPLNQISLDYGVTASTLHYVVARKTWRHV